MIRKSGNRFSERIMLKRDEVLIRFDRIRTEWVEGFAGISRPRRRLLPGGGSKARSLRVPSDGIRPPPSEGPKGGEVPQPRRPLFYLIERVATRLARK